MVALNHLPPRPARNGPRSTYRNVYEQPTRDGSSYRVRVCRTLNLPGRFASPRDAAAFMVGWLEGFFADLNANRAARGQPPVPVPRAVAAVLDKRRNVGYVRRCGGRHVAVVYVLGEPQLVTADVYRRGVPAAKWGAAGDRSWATPAEARAAIKAWVRRFRANFGLFERYAGLWLWR